VTLGPGDGSSSAQGGGSDDEKMSFSVIESPQ
jgi:hypothetical protein